MRRIRIAGLCLVAILVMSAIASASASAEAPEFGRCLKIAKGVEKELSLFVSSKCTLRASEVEGTEAEKLKRADYEWVPGAVAGENSFTATGGGGNYLASVKGELILCESEEATGSYKLGGNNKEVEVVLTFKGCQEGFVCTSPGRHAGEIVTNPLIGIVGFNKEPKESDTTRQTLLQLHAAAPEGHFADFRCPPVYHEERGNGPKDGILVQIGNDAMKAEETLKYTEKSGVQTPTKWFPPEAGYSESQFLEDDLQNSGYVQFGQFYTTKLTNVGKVKYELNAFL